MKKNKKIIIFITLFFVVIASIIVGRYFIELHFKKKFSNRPPPGVIVKIVESKSFVQTLETYGTALSSKTKSYRIKKDELLEPIVLNRKVKKNEIIAKLVTEDIIAPYDGVLGKRGISESTLGSENLMIITLDDSSIIYSDLKVPEIYASNIKKGLKLKVKFAAYKDKIYLGEIESVATRVDAQTRSILARAKIKNENLELLPGSLLEIEIFYDEKNALSIPDTSIMYEGNKKFIYKVLNNNITEKLEIKTGIRNNGNLEVLFGLEDGEKIIAEGLTKIRPGIKVKPIIK